MNCFVTEGWGWGWKDKIGGKNHILAWILRKKVIAKTFILLGPLPPLPSPFTSCDKAVHRALWWELKIKHSSVEVILGPSSMSISFLSMVLCDKKDVVYNL